MPELTISDSNVCSVTEKLQKLMQKTRNMDKLRYKKRDRVGDDGSDIWYFHESLINITRKTDIILFHQNIKNNAVFLP